MFAISASIIISIQAQRNINLPVKTDKCYEYLINRIDSLRRIYTISDFTNNSGISYNEGNCFPFLSETEQNKIIDKIENMYAQKVYIGLYDFAGDLLMKLYKWDNPNKINKRIVEIWYNRICYFSNYVDCLGFSKDYSENSKKRLYDILEKRWTQEDINAWKIINEHSLKKDFTNYYRSKSIKIMKATNRMGEDIEKTILDSLLQDSIDKKIKININTPVSKNCILMIGSLNDRRFVPLLEKMIEEYKEDKDSIKIKEACTYALAKLGVQKYLDQVYYVYPYINYKYLGTKEAFLKQFDKDFVWNQITSIYPYQPQIPSALVALYHAVYLAGYLKNIPPEIEMKFWNSLNNFIYPQSYKNYNPEKDEKNKENIQKATEVYNWIKNNPDKWEIPPAKDSF